MASPENVTKSLQIKTIHCINLKQPLGQRSNHCRSRNSIRGHIPMYYKLAYCLQPTFSTNCISALLHFHDSKQRRGDRAILLLSPHVCFITRRRTWAPWQPFSGTCFSRGIKKNASWKKWHELVPQQLCRAIIQASFCRAWIALQHIMLHRSFSVEPFSCYVS